MSALEKLAAIYAGQWVWIGFDRRHQIVVPFVVGRHDQAQANQVVEGIRDRADGQLPFSPSDQGKHDDDALLAAYGGREEVARTGKRGRPRKPIPLAPKEWLQAQVVKRRKQGRVVEVSSRVVSGTKKAVRAKLKQSPVSQASNTSFVERNHLTMPQHHRRLVRKTMAFSKKQEGWSNHYICRLPTIILSSRIRACE